jgi:hypothetical protein
MAKRQVFHSVPTKEGGWKVTKSNKTVSNHKTQAAAEASAAAAGRKAERQGGLGQAVFHKSDGSFKVERTYGEDPPNRKG